MKRGNVFLQERFSWSVFVGLVVLNLQSVAQAALFIDPSLPLAWEVGRIAEVLLRTVGWACTGAMAVGLLPWRARQIGAVVLVAASVLLAGIDAFTLAHYHTVFDAGLLEIVLATNPAEAWEYVTSQAGGIAAVVLALGAGIAIVAFGRQWLRKRNGGHVFLRLPLWGRCPEGAERVTSYDIHDSTDRISNLVTTLPSPPRIRSAPPPRGEALGKCVLVILLLLFAASLAHAAENPDDRFENALRANSLLRLACNLDQAQEEIGSAEYVAYTLASHDVSGTVGAPDIPYVVFILGESTSRHHMQLYGYGLPTTPRLANRDAAGELVVCQNVTSPHAGTMAVLRTLFSYYDTAAEKDANGMWYDYGDLFDILRAAGVQTAWLSNQEASGFYGSIGRTLGERTDHVAFTSPVAHSIDLTERYDGEILPLLDETLSEREAEPVPSSFYVLHLMGAHEEFSKRYPPAYALFTAEDERGRGVANDEDALAVRASYDNAVLYDDAIVDAIIQRFEDKDALVIFLSDHGEEVYDTRAQFGHGDETSPWQRDVPLVFWMSEAFRAQHAADAARIAAARETHWQSDEMIHTLLDLLHVRAPGFDEKKSLLDRDEQAET